MPEPGSNIRPTCEHRTRPRAEYLSIADERFVGCFVKKAFQVLGHKGVEHCWVEIRRVISPGILEGALNNDPIHNIGVVDGDTVRVLKSEIELAMDRGAREF